MHQKCLTSIIVIVCMSKVFSAFKLSREVIKLPALCQTTKPLLILEQYYCNYKQH